MADNFTTNAGSGGDTFAADDIGGVKYPRSKLVIGADNSNDGDVSATNPLPVKGTGTAGTANSGVVTIQGIASMTAVQVADNSGSLTVDNGGTFAVQVDGTALTRLTDIETNTDSCAVVGNGAAATAQRVTLANDSTGIVALTTSTASIGKLAANSGVDIGDVDVLTVPSDPFGANADAASATGSISAKLRFIASTGIPITGTVTVGSHAVTNAGTFAVQVDGTALTRLTDIETNTDSLAVVGNGAAATALRVTLANDSTGIVSLTTSTASIGKLAANSGVDIGDVDVASIAAGDNNIGNVDIVTVPTDPFGANADAASATGSISAKLRFIASTGIPITGTVTVGSHAVTNAGTFAVQVDGNALTALQKIDDPVIVDDAAFTPATSSVMMAGFQADETGTDSVDEGDAGAARMTLDRKVIVNPQPHTAGGLSVFRSLDLDETEEDVKTSPGCLYKIRITNRTTSVRYVKLYNDTAANVIVGTTAPLDTIPVPANASDYTVLTESFGGMGLTFSVALSIAATTGFADNDTGAPGANDIIVSCYYK